MNVYLFCTVQFVFVFVCAGLCMITSSGATRARSTMLLGRRSIPSGSPVGPSSLIRISTSASMTRTSRNTHPTLATGTSRTSTPMIRRYFIFLFATLDFFVLCKRASNNHNSNNELIIFLFDNVSGNYIKISTVQ